MKKHFDGQQNLAGLIFEFARTDNAEDFGTLDGQYGVDLTCRNASGRTPLHVAAMHGSTAFLEAAREHPTFDPWIRDPGGRLAIDHARAWKHRDAFEVLFAKMYPPGWFMDGQGLSPS